jgi:hypothetical protein
VVIVFEVITAELENAELICDDCEHEFVTGDEFTWVPCEFTAHGTLVEVATCARCITSAG